MFTGSHPHLHDGIVPHWLCLCVDDALQMEGECHYVIARYDHSPSPGCALQVLVQGIFHATC